MKAKKSIEKAAIRWEDMSPAAKKEFCNCHPTTLPGKQEDAEGSMEDVIGKVTIPRGARCVMVRGAGMAPTVLHGQAIVWQPGTPLDVNAMAVVVTKMGESLLRYVYQNEKGFLSVRTRAGYAWTFPWRDIDWKQSGRWIATLSCECCKVEKKPGVKARPRRAS